MDRDSSIAHPWEGRVRSPRHSRRIAPDPIRGAKSSQKPVGRIAPETKLLHLQSGRSDRCGRQSELEPGTADQSQLRTELRCGTGRPGSNLDCFETRDSTWRRTDVQLRVRPERLHELPVPLRRCVVRGIYGWRRTVSDCAAASCWGARLGTKLDREVKSPPARRGSRADLRM